jgi:hypothetical protein
MTDWMHDEYHYQPEERDPSDHPWQPSRNTEDEVGCDYCGAPREAHQEEDDGDDPSRSV